MLRFPKNIMTALALARLLHLDAHATENGQISYPVGVNTVLNGVLPPPGGTQFYSYTLDYAANKFAGPDGKSLLPGFHVNAFVEAPRVIHTWDFNLGPFTL